MSEQIMHAYANTIIEQILSIARLNKSFKRIVSYHQIHKAGYPIDHFRSVTVVRWKELEALRQSLHLMCLQSIQKSGSSSAIFRRVERR